MVREPERAGGASRETEDEDEARRRAGPLARPQPGEEAHAEQGELDPGEPLRAHPSGEGVEQPERAAAGEEAEPLAQAGQPGSWSLPGKNRQTACRGRYQREEQVGEGEAEADHREDGADRRRPAREGGADRLLEQGHGPGERQRHGAQAGEQVAPGPRPRGAGGREGELQQAPQVEGEQRRGDHEQGADGGLLEQGRPVRRQSRPAPQQREPGDRSSSRRPRR